MKYAVIIPTLNRPHLLGKCLQTIRDQTVPPAEFILVDQSDKDDTRQFFEAFDFGKTKKRYIHQKTKSLTLARNNGLDQAGDVDFIGFLDDDMELFPDFYEKLLQRFAEDKDKAYAGGMGTVKDVEFHPDYFARFFLIPTYGDGKFLPNGLPTFPHWIKEFKDVEFLSGGMALFRAPIVKKFRYDEKLVGFGHGDDWDITYRISRAHKLFYEPAAKMLHPDGAPGKDGGFTHRRQQIQNAFYLLKKNTGFPPKVKAAFAWYVFGQTIDDLRKRRLGAVKGDLLGALNILRNRLDSVLGYDK